MIELRNMICGIYRNNEIKIWEVELSNCDLNNFEPGKVLDIENNNTIKVKTSDSAILLTKHNFEILPSVGKYIR